MTNEVTRDAIDAAALEQLREDPDAYFESTQKSMPEMFRREPYVKTPLPVEKIARILGDASNGTVSPERALDIAQRALDEACDNREGKRAVKCQIRQ